MPRAGIISDKVVDLARQLVDAREFGCGIAAHQLHPDYGW
jgi:hypothetical protein